jgi:hypothetical protein
MKAHLLLLCCCYTMIAHAQQTFFSQPYSMPMNVSPALVGAINAKNRLVVVYRQPNAPNTEQRYGVSFDQKNVLRNKDYMGWGTSLEQQTGGFLNKNVVKGGLGYGKYLGGTGKGNAQYLVASGEIAVQQNALDIYKLASFYSNNLPLTADGFLRTSFKDMSIGALWYSTWQKGQRAHIGMVWHHLNKPDIGFINPEQLPFGYTIHTNCELPLATQLKFVPTAIVNQQGAMTDIKAGMSLKITADDTLGIQSGFFLRYDNTRTPKLTRQTLSIFFNLDYYQSSIRFIYDVSLGTFALNNGLEIAYIRLWGAPKHKGGRVPIF